MPAHPIPRQPEITETEVRMRGAARDHVLLHGYPSSDRQVERLVHALQSAIPSPRTPDVTQPGKSAAARKARLATLAAAPEPTVRATGGCHQEPCKGRPYGWRLYVRSGWLPVCVRHMGGAKAIGRRLNSELPAEAGQ